MHPGLFGEQVTDGCVIFDEPVLALTACAAGNTQGARMDGVAQLTPSSLHKDFFQLELAGLPGVGSVDCSITEPHLGDNKAVIRSAISVKDHLVHQRVFSTAHPNENIVQQPPAPRSRTHLGHHLPHRQTEESADQQEVVSCAGSQEKETIFVAAADSVRTQHPPPGSAACSDVGVEVTKDSQLAHLQHRRQEGV
ncbi:hypothetical protein SprV_0100277000 [Sparganum proliferum]